MRTPVLLLAAVMLSLTVPAFAQSEEATTPPAPATKVYSDAEKAAIEDIIRDYLVVKHPEVLMDAMKELQRRDQAGAANKSKEAITAAKDRIYNSSPLLVGGNPKGDVTVVEFFDYQCGYCKMSEESTEKLLKDDKNVRFIYKEFPILGPVSVTASKAAYAAERQGKYIKFHDALMAKKDHLTEEMIYATAKDVGLDVEKLKKEMADNTTDKQVKEGLALGQDIGVRGTPMFIVGDQVYPGALQYDALKKAVDDARAAKK